MSSSRMLIVGGTVNDGQQGSPKPSLQTRSILALRSECAILESLQLSQAGSKLARAASSCGVTFKLQCGLWFEIFGIGNIPLVFHQRFTRELGKRYGEGIDFLRKMVFK
eukprot:s320_g7.t1